MRHLHQLTFQHRAGVTPYTSTFVFAECCVFDKQSRQPGFCDRSSYSPHGPPSSRLHLLPKLRCHVHWIPSPEFSQAPENSHPAHLCRFTVRLRQLKLRGFSWKRGISDLTIWPGLAARRMTLRICQEDPPTCFPRDNQRPVHLPFSVPTSH